MKTLAEFQSVYSLPLADLILRAAAVHQINRGHGDIQRCALLSIKTGGCPEDCKYCSQSAHYDSPVDRQPLMTVGEVRTAATRAKEQGASRFCMGAAWRTPTDGPEFDRVLKMVRTVRDLDMDQLQEVRDLWAFYRDRRPDSYGPLTEA